MNNTEAKKACRLSASAYGEPSGATIVKVRTAKAIIVRYPDCIWIAVEGTRPKFWDWIKNLWITKTEFFGLQVHSGCAREARLLLPLIIQEIAGDGQKYLKLTGHSQGGGVAPLLAWALTANDYHVSAGYGFASMRSIGKESCSTFDSLFSERWLTIARGKDIVPHLPVKHRFGDYGKSKYFDDNGALVDGIPTPLHYLGEVGLMALRRRLPRMWADHDIHKYLANMNTL